MHSKRSYGALVLLSLALGLAAAPSKQSTGNPQGLYAMQATDIDGNDFDLAKLKGHISLVVNVASN
eukprot:9145424-Pyramimonas_sp.AAC.1